MIMRRSPSGFGLLEVVFSTAIFVVVVGSMVSLGRIATRNAVLSTHRAQAFNLAQDAIESVRQLRDSAWISRSTTSRGNESDDWISYLTCDTAAENYEKVFTTDLYALNYNQSYNGFCLQKASFPNTFANTAVIDQSSIILNDGQNRTDPGSPLSFKRVVRFEAVPNTNEACSPNIADFTGLQFLAPDSAGNVCTKPDSESIHVIKVVSTVYWRDFNRDWSVSLYTILTNWRSK